MKSDAVQFLSLGPGHPELLTQQAIDALRRADVVFVPATKAVSGAVRSRAASIVAPWCPPERQQQYVLPMQKDRTGAEAVYDRLTADIADAHREGRRVAVAVEGDISIYASIHYVLERLQAQGISVEQLAGIPSFIAAASVDALSLVSQQERLLVIPGSTTADELHRLLDSGHNVVVMKLSQCQDELKTLLRQHPSTRCHYFENIGTAQQFSTTDHDTIIARPIPYFALAILLCQ